MALEKLTLASLEKTKLKNMFDGAMDEVLHSLCHDKDVPGDRGITVKLAFKQKDGYIITAMKCTASVPGREVSTIASLEDDQTLKIDTVSQDARQPDLYDNDKVTPISAAKKEGNAS